MPCRQFLRLVLTLPDAALLEKMLVEFSKMVRNRQSRIGNVVFDLCAAVVTGKRSVFPDYGVARYNRNRAQTTRARHYDVPVGRGMVFEVRRYALLDQRGPCL